MSDTQRVQFTQRFDRDLVIPSQAVKPPLAFRLGLLARRLFVCAPFGHHRVNITTYEPYRVIIRDCCRRCGTEFRVMTGPRIGPQTVHRHVISKRP